MEPNIHHSDIALPSNFIRDAMTEDLKNGRCQSIVTRFPPEPNGYLHIGHAKAICIDFGLAKEFGGRCHLRMDDTNPAKEEQEYIDAIEGDIRWLGFEWGKHGYHASDYFEQLYQWAILLIKAGKAYVCDISAEEMSKSRGTLTEPGKNSPFRERPVAESLDLFARMKQGEFPDGSRTLRAKIDMASPNLNLRDPVMYRIKRDPHPRTGTAWCIYPMYDYAHGESDWIEGITHSICTLEYEDHRPLYEWYIEQIDKCGGAPKGSTHRPKQYEFARLNLTYTVMSKRLLLRLVKEGHVTGWDDPRMPTLTGLRRRGYTAESVRHFCERIGVAKRDSTVDLALLEHCLREDLNKRAPRYLAVLKPLKVIIDNYPENQVEEFEAVNNPEDLSMGTRKLPFSREIYIEQDDFMEVPAKKYHRLYPGNEVRLRYAYFIKCISVNKDPATGKMTEIHCTYDPDTRGGDAKDGRKVKGTIHWVSAARAFQSTVRLYETLFTQPDPMEVPEESDFLNNLNPNSIEILHQCFLEPALRLMKPGTHCQFERLGYFVADSVDSKENNPVFNRAVTLKDSWAKIVKNQG